MSTSAFTPMLRRRISALDRKRSLGDCGAGTIPRHNIYLLVFLLVFEPAPQPSNLASMRGAALFAVPVGGPTVGFERSKTVQKTPLPKGVQRSFLSQIVPGGTIEARKNTVIFDGI
jgi:hypothetical protein